MENVTVTGPFLNYNNNDHTALVVIVTVFFCLLMIMSKVAKVIIRYRHGISLQDLDIILFVAAILMLVQTICIICASSPGLGKHSTIATLDVEKIQKLQYVASLLATTAITCAKISTSLLIKKINDYGRVRLANRVTQGLIMMSFASGFLATAFQCPLPKPWNAANPSECPSIASIYRYGGVMSIITDLQLCVLAIAMVWDIKMDLRNRFVVITLFCSRILCPATTILALLNTDFLFRSNDFTWQAVGPTVWLQISYNLSVTTACIPSMKNVFDSFSGNFSAAIDVPYNLAPLANKSGSAATARDGQATGGSHSTMYGLGLKLTPAQPSQTSCYTSDGYRSGTRTQDDDDGQSESVRNLTDGIVVVTEEVDIQFENRPPSTDRSHGSWDSTHPHMSGSA